MGNDRMKPAMGWNSWNSFGYEISDQLIRETADAMAERGFLEAGYEYVIIDDCWSLRRRGEDGNMIPDPAKFPWGMKALSDYIHGKGMKFGMYSCCGAMTCAGFPGSLDHEFADADMFARWGVDYLKYDNCFKPESIPSELLYRRMAMALRSCGRDILLAACQWGTESVHQWIRSSGADTYRSTGDIQDSWASITGIVESQWENQPYGAPGCFNDMDMLVVGMYGKGLNPDVISGGCSNEEYMTHFALWCMMGSPLIIGGDVREMSDAAVKILTNKDLITINQDPVCHSCYRLKMFDNAQGITLVKPLADGSYAVGMFNFGDGESNMALNFWDLGIGFAENVGLEIYDCITHKSLGTHYEYFRTFASSHACKVYRMRVVR